MMRPEIRVRSHFSPAFNVFLVQVDGQEPLFNDVADFFPVAGGSFLFGVFPLYAESGLPDFRGKYMQKESYFKIF